MFFGITLIPLMSINGGDYVPINSKLQHPPPPGISREFDFKSFPGSREFDVLSLPCGGAFDKGGEFEPKVVILPVFACFLHAQKRLRIRGKCSFLRFRGKRPQFCEKLAQRNGHGKAMCFICVKMLNFHKVSKLFK